MEDLALLDLVDFVEDDLEAFEGRAFRVHAVDDVRSGVGHLVADEGAMCLHSVAVVDTDELDRSTGTVRAVPCLDGRHGFLVVWVVVLLLVCDVGGWLQFNTCEKRAW